MINSVSNNRMQQKMPQTAFKGGFVGGIPLRPKDELLFLKAIERVAAARGITFNHVASKPGKDVFEGFSTGLVRNKSFLDFNDREGQPVQIFTARTDESPLRCAWGHVERALDNIKDSTPEPKFLWLKRMKHAYLERRDGK